MQRMAHSGTSGALGTCTCTPPHPPMKCAVVEVPSAAKAKIAPLPPTHEVGGHVGAQGSKGWDGIELIVLLGVGGALEHVEHPLQPGKRQACAFVLSSRCCFSRAACMRAVEEHLSRGMLACGRPRPEQRCISLHTCVMVKPPPTLTADTSTASAARACAALPGSQPPPASTMPPTAVRPGGRALERLYSASTMH